MNQKFPWKRFWCTPEGILQLEESGYLVDPEGEYGKYLNPDVVGFENIQNVPCLILLGEPGIGKSQAIADEIEKLRKEVSEKDDLILFIDLKAYGGEERLWKDLFESETWKKFQQSKNDLHLFIDSLDEARLRIPTVTSLILDGLKTVPTERLFLRIACRTAEWPWSFKEGLSKLWTNDQVKVYELSPLRLIDVQKALNILGLNPTEFITAVDDKNAGPLASKPITLNFLLNLFKKESGFPASQIELYEKGCLYLCEEPDEEKREKNGIDSRSFATSLQRFVIASRIAAALLLSNRFAIYTDIDHGDMSDDYINFRELIGGKEKADSNIFEVTERSVGESLKTGLFTSRGAHLMGFAHQTYAESLAARYLEDIPIEQIKALFAHPNDINKIIPQLHETIAWLAGQRHDIFSWIISIEPEILLRSDVSKVDDETKGKVVSELLSKFENEELFDDYNFRKYYKKLSHAKISEQLEPYITKKEVPSITRYVALEIAEACGAKKLQDTLVKICLDQNEDYDIRVQAASVICKIAHEEFKKKLEPLAKGEAGDDPDDQLRAYGMRCMWPKHWNSIEFLKHITVPKKDLLGAYFWFLKYEVISQMPTPDLKTSMSEALKIIMDWPYEEGGLNPLSIISDKIVSIAWPQIPDMAVMEALSNLILTRIKAHKPICDGKIWEAISTDSNKRHEMVKFMIERAEINEKLCGTFAYGQTALLLDSDFPWLLEQIEAADPAIQGLWATCIINTLRDNHPREWIDNFLEVRSQVPVLQKKYPAFWEIDSELSRDAKENYVERLRWEKGKIEKTPDPPISKRIETSLRQIEGGIIEEWINLTYHLSVDQSTGELHEWPHNIQETPGWQTSDEIRQGSITTTAKKFVSNYIPENDEWFGKNLYSRRVLSIYLAIRLSVEDNEYMDNMSDAIWGRLVPYIIDSPASNDRPSYCWLFNLAYQRVPGTTRQYFQRLMDSEYERTGRIHFIDNLKQCWNDELTPIITDKLKSKDLKPEALRDLVEFLIDIKVPDVDAILIEKIEHLKGKNSSDNKLLTKLFALLLKHWGAKYWSLIWTFFQQRPELTDDILVNLADMTGLREDSFTDTFEAKQIAEFYVLMSNKYSPDEDPPLEGRVTPRHSLGQLRNGLLMKLVNKGTKEACGALENIINKLPTQRPWIVWRLKKAQANMLRKTWIPPTPAQVISLLQDHSKRFVESEEQLLSVVLESLKKIQEYYQGKTKPAELLWNYHKEGHKLIFYPKDEEYLSNDIARRLEEYLVNKGIIVNREVQIQKEMKTDIYINAVSPVGKTEDIRTLTTVIEVKGCWHDELYTAMESQLVNNYMTKNGLRTGIYLVGWYMCDKWDNSDARKGKTPKVTVYELRKQLQEQADQLQASVSAISDLKLLILDLSL